MKFSYTKFPAGGKFPSEIADLPIIEITLETRRGTAMYHCLVDSGADYCYFHADVANAMGIKDIKKGKLKPTTGIVKGAALEAYLHIISYKVGGWENKAEIAFSSELSVPYGILGRNGFFDYFKVEFNHPKKEIQLTPFEYTLHK